MQNASTNNGTPTYGSKHSSVASKKSKNMLKPAIEHSPINKLSTLHTPSSTKQGYTSMTVKTGLKSNHSNKPGPTSKPNSPQHITRQSANSAPHSPKDTMEPMLHSKPRHYKQVMHYWPETKQQRKQWPTWQRPCPPTEP